MVINPMTYGEHFVSRAFRNETAADNEYIIILPHNTEELIQHLDRTRYGADYSEQFYKQIEKALPDALDKLLAGMVKGKNINIEVKL